MKTTILSILSILLGTAGFTQATELEKFRKDLTLFVNYDQGKVDSLPKTAANTARLRKNMESSFLAFVMDKESKDLNSLRKTAMKEGGAYRFDKMSYYFSDLRRDLMNRSTENNVNYSISFYGLYDCKLPNFVSMYIQPFKVSGKDLVIYHYKLNNIGKYFIKDAQSNAVVFSSEALGANPAILQVERIDDKDLLLIEDMGDNGQRALVLNTEGKEWKKLNAFKGKPVDISNNYAMGKSGLRPYLVFAETKSINSMWGKSFLKKYELSYDAANKTISYKPYKKDDKDLKAVEAKWKNNVFEIDDYFLGRDMGDVSVPYSD